MATLRLTDPDDKEPSGSHSLSVIPFLGIGIAAVITARGFPSLDWLDWTLVILFVPFLGWLLSERHASKLDASSHEGARKSLAFRLGKKLNHVLNLLRRNPTVRD